MEGPVLHVNFNEQNLVVLHQVLLGFEISFKVVYPKIKFVPIKSPIKFRHQSLVSNLKVYLTIGTASRIMPLRLRLSLGIMLIDDELLNILAIS